MSEILIAFITGLTTGGLSCLAVQGGLLASSLAQQIEKDMVSNTVKNGRAVKNKITKPYASPALPILLFLGAKLAAYTLLGFLLGWVGSLLTLNSVLRAVLLFAIGIFMLGNALRMFNVHPIFRYFSFQPPSWITRFIRRKARQEVEWFTPVFLGALTVLIPCGVTQAMMVAAMGTGNPISGAALMFAFTLGASPVFFLVAYFATQIGTRLEKIFLRFVAVVVLVMGLVSIDNGAALMGWPSVGNLLQSPNKLEQNAEQPPVDEQLVASEGTLTIHARNNGYYPNEIHASAGTALKIDLVTQNTVSCARDFLIPALKYETLLPPTGVTSLDLPAQEAGTVMRFTCSMGMYTGKIIFDQ